MFGSEWKRLPRKTVTVDLGKALEDLDALVASLVNHPLKPHLFHYRSINRSVALRLAIQAMVRWVAAGRDPWDMSSMVPSKPTPKAAGNGKPARKPSRVASRKKHKIHA